MFEDANVSFAASPACPSPTIEQHAATETPVGEKTPFIHDQFSRSPHTATTSVNIGRTERTSESWPPVTPTVAKPSSVTKSVRGEKKAKKGKKALITGQLAPWPPQNGLPSGSLDAAPIADSSTNTPSLELKTQPHGSLHDFGNLAVKLQSSGICVPIAGLSDTEVRSPFPVPNQHQVEDSVHASSPGPTKHGDFLESAVQEPIDIAGPSDVPEDPSLYAPHEDRVRSLQKQQASDADADTQDGLTLGCKSMAQRPSTDVTPHQALRPTSSGQLGDSSQQASSNTPMTNLDQIQDPSSRLQEEHIGLQEPSSRERPMRVTKTQKKIRPQHKSPSRTSVPLSNYLAPYKMTALDIALDGIRTACHVERNRMEDQMASTVNDLKQEKKQLESTIQQQQVIIAELNAQEKISKENLTHLTDKAKTIQKYVSGLQEDHERCQKLVAVSQKQNMQVFQDLIADTVKEKADLQGAFNQAVDSFRKSRNEMTMTMNETHTQYNAVLSRNTDLEQRLTELRSMYEAEKARTVDLEKQLVPSLQSMQRQLSERAALIDDKLSSMNATLALLASDNRNDCDIKGCLQILQKLDSMPLLTARDVRKAEGMLRFNHERVNAVFQLLVKASATEACSAEDIRRCLRDQTQVLLAEISRRDQSMTDSRLAPEAAELIKLELDTLTRNNHQLQEYVDALRQSEAVLESYSVLIEMERDELQAALQEQAWQSKLDITRVHNELDQFKDYWLFASDTAGENERLLLEREREFCDYRLQAMAYLNGLKEQMHQLTTQLQAKECEHKALQENFRYSKAKLESVQCDHDQLVIEVSQHKSTAETLRQERDGLNKERGTTQASLCSAKETNRILEEDKEKLTATLREARTSLRASLDAEATLKVRYSDLQQQLDELQDAKDASDEQLQKVRNDGTIELQRTKQGYATQIQDLRDRLQLSERDRKESHAKILRMEATRNQQLESHQQETKTKFDLLASESERIRKELETKHERDLKCQRQEANAKIEELQRQLDEMQAKTTSKILVPNSQSSFAHDANSSALQQDQLPKTRKKVNRQTNSVVMVPSSNGRLDTDDRRPTVGRSDLPRSRCGGSEHQVGFFEEEYRNRFGPQATLQEQEDSLPLMNPDCETVPETQEIEFAQGSTAQFVVIESQISVGGNTNQGEGASELSTISSEDLSEMLLDIQSDSGRHRVSSGNMESRKNTARTPERPEQEPTSDAPSSTSQGRPKSRANTASRMVPLPVHDVQRQRVQARDAGQDLAYACLEQNSRADSGHSSNLMHVNNAALQRNHTQLASLYANTQSGNTDVGQKRKLAGDTEQVAPSKRLRVSAQTSTQRPLSISKSYAPYTPAPTSTRSQLDVNPSPPSATGRRSSNRPLSIAGSQTSTPRLSSTRNTRSRANQYADRFGQELDGR
ncbi:hypothetical protein M3J09_005381 [Ascochyta lentis]